MDNTENDHKELLTTLCAEIVSAYVSNNPINMEALPKLVNDTYAALEGMSGDASGAPENLTPAVSIKKSQKHDHLVCLDCGKKFKSLKRHLMASHGLTPKEYRDKWGLSSDYPMVAPAYADVRSQVAKNVGLGRKKKD